MKINILQIAALSIFLSGSLVHTMQMGDEQSSKQSTQAKNSSLNTCYEVTKKCCYLAAACYAAMRGYQAYNTEPMIVDDAAMPNKPCNYISYKPYAHAKAEAEGRILQSDLWIKISNQAPVREYCSEDGRLWWRRGRDEKRTGEKE